MKGELRVTWHFYLDKYVGLDTWRHISCHQRGDVRSGKSGVLQKGTNLFCKERDMVESQKVSFLCTALGLLFGHRLLLNKAFFNLQDFFLSTGIYQLSQEWRSTCIKPYMPKSNKRPEGCRH